MGGHLRALILEQVHLLFSIQTPVVHMRADAAKLGRLRAEIYESDPGVINNMQVCFHVHDVPHFSRKQVWG